MSEKTLTYNARTGLGLPFTTIASPQQKLITVVRCPRCTTLVGPMLSDLFLHLSTKHHDEAFLPGRRTTWLLNVGVLEFTVVPKEKLHHDQS